VLKLVAGNPGHRPINRREPQPRSGAPRCPAWLGAEGHAVWKRLVPELKAMGVLSRADGEALAALCQAYVRWRQAEEFIDKHGPVFPLRDEKGQIRCMMPFPQVAIARHMAALVKGYLQEFGMTPASRSRIELPWRAPGQVHDGVCDRLGRPC